MYEVHIYIETDSISPRPTNKQYGYVLECRTAAGDLRTREGFGRFCGTYNRVVLRGIIEAMNRLNQPCEVHVHTENDFVVNMIERNLEHWAAEGFLTTKGTPVANREEWEQLWKLAQTQLLFAGAGRHAYYSWLLSEMERRKNEQQNCKQRGGNGFQGDAAANDRSL